MTDNNAATFLTDAADIIRKRAALRDTPDGERSMRRAVAAYDYEKIIAILMERDGMSSEEAAEFIDFNIDGTYAGEQTPIIIFMGGDDDAH